MSKALDNCSRRLRFGGQLDTGVVDACGCSLIGLIIGSKRARPLQGMAFWKDSKEGLCRSFSALEGLEGHAFTEGH